MVKTAKTFDEKVHFDRMRKHGFEWKIITKVLEEADGKQIVKIATVSKQEKAKVIEALKFLSDPVKRYILSIILVEDPEQIDEEIVRKCPLTYKESFLKFIKACKNDTDFDDEIFYRTSFIQCIIAFKTFNVFEYIAKLLIKRAITLNQERKTRLLDHLMLKLPHDVIRYPKDLVSFGLHNFEVIDKNLIIECINNIPRTPSSREIIVSFLRNNDSVFHTQLIGPNVPRIAEWITEALCDRFSVETTIERLKEAFDTETKLSYISRHFITNHKSFDKSVIKLILEYPKFIGYSEDNQDVAFFIGHTSPINTGYGITSLGSQNTIEIATRSIVSSKLLRDLMYSAVLSDNVRGQFLKAISIKMCNVGHRIRQNLISIVLHIINQDSLPTYIIRDSIRTIKQDCNRTKAIESLIQKMEKFYNKSRYDERTR